MEQNGGLRRELAAAQAENYRLWLQANMPYFVAFAIVGLVVLYIFTRMFSTACVTCRACISCCDDLTTKDNDHLIIHKAGGTELGGIPGMVAPVGETMDPTHQRITELEGIVAQLDTVIPNKK